VWFAALVVCTMWLKLLLAVYSAAARAAMPATERTQPNTLSSTKRFTLGKKRHSTRYSTVASEMAKWYSLLWFSRNAARRDQRRPSQPSF